MKNLSTLARSWRKKPNKILINKKTLETNNSQRKKPTDLINEKSPKQVETEEENQSQT